MVYLYNTNLDNKKTVKVALKKIYGIGENFACQICDNIGITQSVKIKQLTNYQIEKIAFFINQKKVLGPELKQQKRKNIQRLIKIGCFKGFRHTEKLPCRGQRTHGNAQTVRKLKIS